MTYDQTLRVLQRSYTFQGSPASIDNVELKDKPIFCKLNYFGKAVRNRVFCPALYNDLISIKPEIAISELCRVDEMVEYIWLLFGAKQTQKLVDFYFLIPLPGRRKLPGHIHDLVLISLFLLRPLVKRRKLDFKEWEQKIREVKGSISLKSRQGLLRWACYSGAQLHTKGFFRIARYLFALSRTAEYAGPVRATKTINFPYGGSRKLGEIDIRSISSASNTVIVSCNRHYFDKFFEGFCRSFFCHNVAGESNWGLHLHCIDFDPQSIEFSGPAKGIGISVEYMPKLPLRHIGAYSACARYLHLPIFQRVYKKTYVSDVDGIMTGSLDEAFEGRCGDVSFWSPNFLNDFSVPFPLPWNSTPAGNVFLSDTKGAKIFANKVSSYLMRVFERAGPEDNIWYADQNALFYSLLELRGIVSATHMKSAFFQQANDWRMFSSDQKKRDFQELAAR